MNNASLALFPERSLQRDLHQWYTPAWAAEAILEQEFPWLGAGHRVIEPAAGDGAFLCALPANVDAIGVEIDPTQAALARRHSGRPVITGDFLAIPPEQLGRAHAVIGNPPFAADLIARFLERSEQLLDDGGQVGFILPAYVLQTSSKVEALSRRFSICSNLLPRNLFPRLKLPLVFARFIKEQPRRLVGFLLYREAQDVNALQRCWKKELAQSRDRNGVWYPVIRQVLASLGGEADLAAIYAALEGKRPTANRSWKEKVRQVLQNEARFVRVAIGRYALPSVVTAGACA